MELNPSLPSCKTLGLSRGLVTAPRRPPTRIFGSKNQNTKTSDTTADVKTKIAVAAKIRAARTLARKLAEEKEAAAAAAQLASQSKLDAETAAELIRSAKAEVAELAKEAAHADAQARSATKSSATLEELQQLKAQNAALTEMVMQVAADRAEAEKKLEALRRGQGTTTTTKSKPPKSIQVKEESKTSSQRSSQQNWTEVMLRAAELGTSSHVRVTTVPEAPEVGTTVRIMYDLSAGPLPKDPSTAPALKMGLNRWESQAKAPMQQAFPKKGTLDSVSGWWWYVDVPLPKLLFRVDFVVEDMTSGAVDNNGGKDFTFDLQGAPTSEEVTAARLELLEAHEAAARARFDKEEQRMKRVAMSAAEGAAREAALAYLATRKDAMLAEARAVVSERRGATAQANPNYQHAADAIEGILRWEEPPVAGETAVMFYRPSGPLAQVDFGDFSDEDPSEDPTENDANYEPLLLHLGYDNWWMKDTRISPMKRHKDGWWSVQVPVWKTAGIVDFVFSNSACTVWDNNGGKDYHTVVRNAASGELLVASVLSALESAGAEETARGEALASRRVLQRAATKSEAGRRRREMQRRFLYTDPVVPVAGQKVEVYYNPDKTVLRGRPDIYVCGSFNRWTHTKPFGPVRMEPAVPDAGGIGFQVTTVHVPADAHTIDLVFSDSAAEQNSGSGFCDNNNGLDYHIPVSGNSTISNTADGGGRSDVLRVSHVAAEMAPIAKAGGLGDVVTALGRAVQEEGHHVDVVLPKYDCIDYSAVEDLVFEKEFGWDNTSVKVWRGTVEGLETVFLEPCNGLFWVGRIYTDMGSDRHRFGVFCACAIKYLLYERGGQRPDVIHAHDWQSAPVMYLPKDGVPVSCVFTIHNLNYGADLIGKAMAAAQVATTVSPTYAAEVAGHPAIAPHQSKFYGVRNGIDTDVWDPAADPFVPEPFYVLEDSDTEFDFEVVRRGKAAAKALLRKRMGLGEGDVPLVGCVTRLTPQKGIHLIKHAAWRAMERGAQFILLGSAPDPAVQADFDALAADLAARYPDRARLWFAYDEGLAHLIYAASDIFLVPSMFEPCGLTQMIAMRYGAVPVVRRTGGLADTVFDVDDDAERAAQRGMTVNGYSFDGADAAGMDYALNRALTAWYEGGEWDDLVAAVMRIDWSWAGPAQDYIEIYYKATRSLSNA